MTASKFGRLSAILLRLVSTIDASLASSRVSLDSDIAIGWGQGTALLKSMENGYNAYGHSIVAREDNFPVRLG